MEYPKGVATAQYEFERKRREEAFKATLAIPVRHSVRATLLSSTTYSAYRG